jgi:tetratricopeptide (TPR) repeat protein
LAAYGFFAFLILLAPTSSVLPIRDPLAERRMYFAMFGLLLVTADLLRRVKLPRATLAAACGALLLIAAIATHARAEVWSSELTLWQDTEAKSPDKPRGHFQLANAYFNNGDCDRASAEFQTTDRYKPDGYTRYNLLVDWGLALDCAGRQGEALAKLREAAALEPTAHIYSQIAKVMGEQKQWNEALSALDQAEKIDATFAPTFAYRGIIYFNTGRCAEAVTAYGRAIGLDPQLEPTVRQGLSMARQCAATRPAARVAPAPAVPPGAGR